MRFKYIKVRRLGRNRTVYRYCKEGWPFQRYICFCDCVRGILALFPLTHACECSRLNSSRMLMFYEPFQIGWPEGGGTGGNGVFELQTE